MLLVKVANQGGSAGFVRFHGGDGDDDDQEQRQETFQQPPPSQFHEVNPASRAETSSGQVFQGIGYTREMVSALRDVVSGRQQGDCLFGSGFGGAVGTSGSSFIYSPSSYGSSASPSGSGSGSGSWVGQKRGREDDGAGASSSSQLIESGPRVYGGFGDFTVSPSSRGATGNIFFFNLFPSPKV